MSRTLETLIKRVRKDIDELAIEVARAQDARNEILTEKATSAASVEAEAAMFDGSPLSGLGMSAFLQRQAQRQSELDEALGLAETAQKECQAALSGAFTELKRLEHLLAQEKLRERMEREKAEQAAFDERSSQMHARKGGSGL
ncbi:MAG: hypothetical protein CMK07_09535 [Ponticaulis sp.]|nr:hypothetical protein [Ponticaulis sp.]